MHPGSARRRQLRGHSVAGEEHGVVAGLRDLGRVVDRGRIRGDRLRPERVREIAGGRLAGDRHQRHLAALDTAGRHVGVTEAGHERVVAVVAAVVHRPFAGVGTEADHPVRQHRAGADESGRKGADHRIDPRGEVRVGGGWNDLGGGGDTRQAQRSQDHDRKEDIQYPRSHRSALRSRIRPGERPTRGDSSPTSRNLRGGGPDLLCICTEMAHLGDSTKERGRRGRNRPISGKSAF